MQVKAIMRDYISFTSAIFSPKNICKKLEDFTTECSVWYLDKPTDTRQYHKPDHVEKEGINGRCY